MNPRSPPTVFLPPIRRLQTLSLSQISEALEGLKALYLPDCYEVILPPIPMAGRKVSESDVIIPDSGYASAEEDSDSEESDTTSITSSASNDLLRLDPIERDFAIKWLTVFIGQSDELGLGPLHGGAPYLPFVDIASSLLSALINGAADESSDNFDVERPFTFLIGASDEQEGAVTTAPSIRVVLNDAPLITNDHSSVGLQSWASAVLLADRLCREPDHFFPSNLVSQLEGQIQSTGLTVLELGAGTGLLSLVTAKLQRHFDSASVLNTCRHFPGIQDIVATDYHPDVLANLSTNVSKNSELQSIKVHALDWDRPDHPSLPFERSSEGNPVFDIILGADIIYHPDHARMVKDTVEMWLRKPSRVTRSGIFWLMIAVRNAGRHLNLHLSVDEVFGSHSSISVNSLRLAIVDQVNIARRDIPRGAGRTDEDGYKLFQIEWVEH
jgi:protein-lysine N-methyltransferase EEF2KMT